MKRSAKFTVLDVSSLDRLWLDVLQANGNWLADAPAVWRKWRETGYRRALTAVRSLEIRTRDEQLPASDDDALLKLILDARKDDSPRRWHGVPANDVIDF